MKAKCLWGMVLVLLVALVLRVAALGQVPPGLYHDEAYYGLDAANVLRGQFSLYFAANNGREPLFIYLVALALGVLGSSPFALRLVSCFVGVLTVAVTAAAGRALFSRRVGVLAAAALAVTLWHVHLSRIGFRAVTLPLLIALTVWQGAVGARTGRARNWLAAGVFYGLSFYTYNAARFTPVALAAFGLCVLIGRAAHPIPWRRVGLAGLGALVTTAPLAVYALGHVDVVLGRVGQVSVFSPAINGGDLWGALALHTLRTLGMFFVCGDRIWRHNVPWRPVFDPLLGIAFIVGVVAALRGARRNAAYSLVLLWTAVMALPTLLAEDAPHFLRAVGMLPVLAFLPALGMEWIANCRLQIANRHPRPAICNLQSAIFQCAIVLILVFGLASTVWAYFGDYARNPMTGYWFESGATALGGRINRFLGIGWDGQRMLHGRPDGQRVYVASELWAEWPQVRFLVAAPEAVTVGLDADPSAQGADRVAVMTWPYDQWQRAWDLLPAPAEIVVEQGPLSQGDRDPASYVTYVAFLAGPADSTTPPLARFSGGVELLGVTTARQGDAAQVRLRWRAAAQLDGDYTVFLHYLRDGERVGQGDSQPCSGYFPTTRWRPGDVVNDDHTIAGVGPLAPGRDALLFGLWKPDSGQYLDLLDEAGNPAGVWLVVPLSE